MSHKYHVVAGPYRTARQYVESRGWPEDDYIIVIRGHQLANMDPALILSIVTVKLHTMGQRITDEIQAEIDRLRALWPISMVAAA